MLGIFPNVRMHIYSYTYIHTHIYVYMRRYHLYQLPHIFDKICSSHAFIIYFIFVLIFTAFSLPLKRTVTQLKASFSCCQHFCAIDLLFTLYATLFWYATLIFSFTHIISCFFVKCRNLNQSVSSSSLINASTCAVTVRVTDNVDGIVDVVIVPLKKCYVLLLLA